MMNEIIRLDKIEIKMYFTAHYLYDQKVFIKFILCCISVRTLRIKKVPTLFFKPNTVSYDNCEYNY